MHSLPVHQFGARPVVTATTPVATGDYYWPAANTLYHDGGWPLDTFYYSSSNGEDWNGPQYNAGGNGIFQFAIYATPVPEPSSKMLLGLGGLLFLAVGRWKARTVS